MWSSSRQGQSQVTCIACGESVSRSAAREYDKYGDRWDRQGKEFEYFCKPCDSERCHQPRGSLETLLEDVESNTERCDNQAFLSTYLDLAERRDSVEEP